MAEFEDVYRDWNRGYGARGFTMGHLFTREGELVVSGPGVMRGYWNLPERNAAAFIRDDDGVAWYRTGDLVVEGDTIYRAAAPITVWRASRIARSGASASDMAPRSAGATKTESAASW